MSNRIITMFPRALDFQLNQLTTFINIIIGASCQHAAVRHKKPTFCNSLVMRYQKLIIGFIKLKLVTINYNSDSKTKQNAFSKTHQRINKKILIKPT